MTLKRVLAEIAAGRRAPLVAALVALMASLPTLFTLPAMDRDEARFAEASAQMLESRDFTDIQFQDTPRYKKPVGVYWLQALSVAALSSPEARQVWAYRAPSVLGAMLAAAACAWGALAFLEPPLAAMAGVLMASTTVLAAEATLATTDAALCGTVTLAMAAMARTYLERRGGPTVGPWPRPLFWAALGASILLKGPIGPMVVGLAAGALSLWDRDGRWLARLGWDWGLIILAAMVLPWALAITVATDGGFWGIAVGGDLAPKLFGGQEGHGAPPGYFLLLSPILLFPAVLLLPAGLVGAWRTRVEPGVRFAICWLVPAWIVFELVPTKLPHYTLPAFGALAWLMAAALRVPLGAWSRRIGLALLAAVALGLAVAGAVAAAMFGDAWSWVWAGLAAALLAAAAIAGGVLILRRRAGLAALVACGFGLLAHDAIAGGLAPSLGQIWLSARVAQALDRATDGKPDENGPVAVAGYGEPSLVFALGAPTQLGDASDAAEAIDEGRAAVVERAAEPAFEASLAGLHDKARAVGEVDGLDYSTGHRQSLRLYLPAQTQGGG